MKYIVRTLAITFLSLFIYACEDVSDMAIERVASPVLVEIGSMEVADESYSITASFFELDKSGILDNTVGIDSIPVTNLSITVTALADGVARNVISTLTTDASGKVMLTGPISALDDVSSLEWAGEYKETKFAKIKNL